MTVEKTAEVEHQSYRNPEPCPDVGGSKDSSLCVDQCTLLAGVLGVRQPPCPLDPEPTRNCGTYQAGDNGSYGIEIHFQNESA